LILEQVRFLLRFLLNFYGQKNKKVTALQIWGDFFGALLMDAATACSKLLEVTGVECMPPAAALYSYHRLLLLFHASCGAESVASSQ